VKIIIFIKTTPAFLAGVVDIILPFLLLMDL